MSNIFKHLERFAISCIIYYYYYRIVDLRYCHCFYKVCILLYRTSIIYKQYIHEIHVFISLVESHSQGTNI